MSGRAAQPASWVEHLEQHHHFGEDEGVDEGKALHGEINPMLAHDDALIEHEDAEQNPEIEEKQKRNLRNSSTALAFRERAP